MIKYLIPLVLLLGCSTNPHSDGRSKYVDAIEDSSAGDKKFAGLYHNFEFKATIHKTNIIQSINDRMTQIYQWDDVESAENLQKQMDKAQKETRIFMSFYTPSRQNDNLATKKSIWKVYLYNGSQRYEGHVLKANKVLDEAKSIYPYHNRYATAYFIDFPVATSDIDSADLKLMITGPLGKREVRFR